MGTGDTHSFGLLLQETKKENVGHIREREIPAQQPSSKSRSLHLSIFYTVQQPLKTRMTTKIFLLAAMGLDQMTYKGSVYNQSTIKVQYTISIKKK